MDVLLSPLLVIGELYSCVGTGAEALRIAGTASRGRLSRTDDTAEDVVDSAADWVVPASSLAKSTSVDPLEPTGILSCTARIEFLTNSALDICFERSAM